jgi:predicted alpha/beta superfamily hydrolase
MKLCYKLSIVLFLVFVFQLKAQQVESYKPVTSVSITFYSKVLKEYRKIYIHYPAVDSAHLDRRFPVLYLLDGESHFEMLSQYTDYLSRWDVNVIPKMIVVGIANTKRTRDLTPTESIINYLGQPDTVKNSWMKPSGGNKQFLQFIHEELIPYVDANYNTQPFKIFGGHSFGGLATIHCMLTQPEMFNAYIAISPSFWWDHQYVLKLADKKLKKGTAVNKILFYSDANEGLSDKSTYHTNLLKFDSLLTKRSLIGLTHLYKYYPTETHMTSPMVGYYDALRFIYKDWKE